MKRFKITCPKHKKLLVAYSDKPICPKCKETVDVIIPKKEF